MQNQGKKYSALRLLFFITSFWILLNVTGIQKVMAQVQEKNPYLLKVNRVYNTITAYEQDDKGEYTVPVKAMLCSVGAKGQTKLGTFQTKEKYRWKLLMGDVWGQYSTRIIGGILFHSVYYYENGNPASLATKEFNKLGTAASHGCIRLAVKDAKWIYDNCALGTTVVIYDDKKSPGPLGKPESIKIASNVRWDPTDPDKTNPYADKKPVITGVKNVKTAWNKEINLLKGIKATSSVGTDITKTVSVIGKVDITIPGKYRVKYSVTDILGKTITKAALITVENNTIAPEFNGINDRIISADTIVDEEFALQNIEAACAGIKADKESIEVIIEQLNETKYYITYRASIGHGPVAEAYANFVIDNEAPVFTGIQDYALEADEYPSKSFLLENVTVTDNYTPEEDIIIDVIVTENLDGTYLITYEATDEAGNKAIEQASIIN